MCHLVTSLMNKASFGDGSELHSHVAIVQTEATNHALIAWPMLPHTQSLHRHSRVLHCPCRLFRDSHPSSSSFNLCWFRHSPLRPHLGGAHALGLKWLCLDETSNTWFHHVSSHPHSRLLRWAGSQLHNLTPLVMPTRSGLRKRLGLPNVKLYGLKRCSTFHNIARLGLGDIRLGIECSQLFSEIYACK